LLRHDDVLDLGAVPLLLQERVEDLLVEVDARGVVVSPERDLGAARGRCGVRLRRGWRRGGLRGGRGRRRGCARRRGRWRCWRRRTAAGRDQQDGRTTQNETTTTE